MTFIKYKRMLLALMAAMALTTFFIIWNQKKYDINTNIKTILQADLPRLYQHTKQLYEQNYTQVHEERIRHLKAVCEDKDLFSKRTYRKQPHKPSLYSKKYNLAYTRIPKSGSTLCTLIFLLLNNCSIEESFGQRRSGVHSFGNQFLISSSVRRLKNPRMVLVSRNPYSRLYSGYIDKVYLGLKPHLRQEIETGNKYCNFNITFEQFIQSIIADARANVILDKHWAPIFSMSNPCEVNQYRLVKQETFSKDAEFLLTELSIERYKYEAITKVLHDHRAEETVPGIVREVIRRNKKHLDVLECIGFSGVVHRLWISLQVQGFIDKSIEFPDHAIAKENDFVNATKLSDLILETIRKYPLTPEEMKYQRHEALVSAYRTVSQESIEGIQDVYRPDFELFDYSFDPPT